MNLDSSKSPLTCYFRYQPFYLLRTLSTIWSQRIRSIIGKNLNIRHFNEKEAKFWIIVWPLKFMWTLQKTRCEFSVVQTKRNTEKLCKWYESRVEFKLYKWVALKNVSVFFRAFLSLALDESLNIGLFRPNLLHCNVSHRAYGELI